MKLKELKEKETLYCTKYALTQGIMKCTGTVDHDNFVYVSYYLSGRLGKDFLRTLDEAQARALEMAKKAIKSAHKQLERRKQTLERFKAGEFGEIKELGR